MKTRLILVALALASVPIGDSPTRAEDAPPTSSRVKAMFINTIPSDIKTWVQERNGTVVLESEALKLVAITLPASNADQMIADLIARGDVQTATYDGLAYAHHVRTPLTPNPPLDPHWGEQYGPPLIQLGIPLPDNDAWDYEQGSPSVILAVLDTGVDALHEDLASACTPHCAQAGYDVCGHGTHVAGIAAARANNLKGIAGVAQVKLMALKALHEGTCGGYYSEQAVALVEAATRGAKVINMSFGDDCLYQGVYLCYDLVKAVEIAHDSFGAVLVASTGNEREGGCVGSGCVDYPASDSRVLAVGCITSTKGHCNYSRGGPEIDLVAPGDGILSTCSSQEVRPPIQDPPELPCSSSTTPGYAYRSGTSFAAPHVAGLAALILSHCPGISNTQVESLLRSNVEDLGAPGFDQYFGHGMVRALDALQAAHASYPVLCGQ